MTAPPVVSVIIVSRGRPDALRLCLKGLDQVSYPAFEVIVVADSASHAGCAELEDRIKFIPFAPAIISAARNAGLAQATGDVVAFIDDDAVPEPTWLTHLTAPFAASNVAASGGYVIGRNGISFQWQARMAFPDGNTAPIDLTSDQATVLPGEPGRAIKTEGTNMAVRRDVLLQLGGFDPAFAFYLDETDLNMRIAAAGLATAIAPLAQVHHGFAASARRTAARVPRDLTQIGASIAVFQRKHAAQVAPVAARAVQRARLVRHMVAGNLMPGDVRRLMRGFDRGWQDGMQRTLSAPMQTPAPDPFRPFQATPQERTHHHIAARFWQAKQAHQSARDLVAQGHVVSLYLWSFTAVFHRVRFHPDGYWVQTGGQFGKSLRSDPWFRFWRAKSRLIREKDRTAVIRVPKMPAIG